MSEIKISVIVAIHGVDQYLDKCLSSFLNQDFPLNYEVCCMNDRCVDNSEKIIDSYVEKNPNIFKKFNCDNGNVSFTRNSGIKVATGDYLIFVDGDDYVSPDFLSTLYDTVKKGELNIGCCNFFEAYDDGNLKKDFSSHFVIGGFINHLVAMDYLMGDFRIRGYVWNKIYKRSFLLEYDLLFCNSNIIVEDMWFNSFAFFYNNLDVGCSKKRCYYYVQRQGSLLHQGYKPLHLADIMVNLLLAIRAIELLNVTKFPTKLFTLSRRYLVRYSILDNRKNIPNFKDTLKTYEKKIKSIKKMKSLDEFDEEFLKAIRLKK